MNKKNLCYLLILIFTLPVFGKKGNEHSKDMLLVLGLYSNNDQLTSNQNLEYLNDMFSFINKHIDDSLQFYKELQDKFPYFTWGDYGHRIIYHWGFDLDKDLNQKQYQDSLAQLFNAKIYGYYGDSLTDEKWYDQWNNFLSFLKNNQKKQNQEMTEVVRHKLGLKYSDSRDIAAILYYTHLLGDHAVHEGEVTGDSVLETDKILYNLNIHIKNLTSKKQWLYDNYKNAIERLPKDEEKKYAANIIDTLEIYVPQIMKTQFAKEFNNKGLYFCFEENMEEAS
ncbi:MAG: hypothetical protein WCQ67_08770 [Treponema sp.]